MKKGNCFIKNFIYEHRLTFFIFHVIAKHIILQIICFSHFKMEKRKSSPDCWLHKRREKATFGP